MIDLICSIKVYIHMTRVIYMIDAIHAFFDRANGLEVFGKFLPVINTQMALQLLGIAECQLGDVANSRVGIGAK